MADPNQQRPQYNNKKKFEKPRNKFDFTGPQNNADNYFERNIRQFGINFHISHKTPRDLQFDAVNIFRQLAKPGQIDVSKYGLYFSDPQFLSSLMMTANTKLAYYRISFDGVSLLLASNQYASADEMVIAVHDSHRKAVDAYSLVVQMLEVMRMTGDVNQMIPYSLQLVKNYRGCL